MIEALALTLMCAALIAASMASQRDNSNLLFLLACAIGLAIVITGVNL